MGRNEGLNLPIAMSSNTAIPAGMALLFGGVALYALSKNGESSIWPVVLAGGIGLLALLILYSEGKVDRNTVESELPKKLEDPIQLAAYKRLLDNKELLSLLRDTA